MWHRRRRRRGRRSDHRRRSGGHGERDGSLRRVLHRPVRLRRLRTRRSAVRRDRIGARVITTVSTPDKAELSRQAGAIEVLDYPDDPQDFADSVRDLSDGRGVAAAYDGVGKTTFDASLASLAVRGTLALFGAASGPVPPVDPQRLNAAGSVYLCRPTLAHFTRTQDEFSWRAGELLSAIADGSIVITVGGHYALEQAADAHRDLQARKTTGSVVLLP
jgi:NADPH2:quinone reductase